MREAGGYILTPVYSQTKAGAKRKKNGFGVADRGCGPEVIVFVSLPRSRVSETDSIERGAGKLEAERRCGVAAPENVAETANISLKERNLEFGVLYSI
jgi:hypothetical protein